MLPGYFHKYRRNEPNPTPKAGCAHIASRDIFQIKSLPSAEFFFQNINPSQKKKQNKTPHRNPPPAPWYYKGYPFFLFQVNIPPSMPPRHIPQLKPTRHSGSWLPVTTKLLLPDTSMPLPIQSLRKGYSCDIGHKKNILSSCISTAG